MPERVLIAFDGGEQAMAALEHTFTEFPDATLLVLTVLDPTEAAYITGDEFRMPGTDWQDRLQRDADSCLDQARELATEYNRSIETVTLVGRPRREIVQYATEEDIDHIVLGSRGRTGLRRVLLGSVAESVLRRSPVPVTIVR